jgi:peptide/nickel transport system substrate-binding protein
VVVWVFPEVAEQGRYLVSVLDSLGYRASLKVVGSFPAYYSKVADSRVRAQAGYIATFYGPFPAGVLPLLASCAAFVPASPGQTSNLSEFCDRSIDAQMARAAAAQVQDPAAATSLWQQAERSLLAQAPYVPVYNERAVDLVSKRVGNYQYNPQSGALLDQLWVK